MKLYYFQGDEPNFGDELNPWLWSRLLPDFFSEDEAEIFLGIGSILFDGFPQDSKKIVFGAGYGGYHPPPVLNENWHVYFVRGPRSAAALSLDSRYAVGDGAILIRTVVETRQQKKRHKVSVMPHFESAQFGCWDIAARKAGVNLIDPRQSVDHCIAEIAASELVLTEAMHGAIVADALRVPWVCLQPLATSHRSKWLDWAEALEIDFRSVPRTASNANELLYAKFCKNYRVLRYMKKARTYTRSFLSGRFTDLLAKEIVGYAASEPSLSSDRAMDRVTDRMLEQLAQLRKDWRVPVRSGSVPHCADRIPVAAE